MSEGGRGGRSVGRALGLVFQKQPRANTFNTFKSISIQNFKDEEEIEVEKRQEEATGHHEGKVSKKRREKMKESSTAGSK